MGWGLIRIEAGQISFLAMDTLHIPARLDPYQRLEMIHGKVRELISKFEPDDFAIEAPFYGKNVQSMLKLGRAQGVAIAAAITKGIPVTEYAPRKIKQSITGNGNAGKEQVWKMLQQILKISADPVRFDASDALAVALCHHFQFRLPGTGSRKSSSWSEFAAKHPGRII